VGLVKHENTKYFPPPSYMSRESFVTLCKSSLDAGLLPPSLRSRLEYANNLWSAHYQELIKRIEKVQMRATRLLPQIKVLSYQERLRTLDLPTLKNRILRGDMIELYKIITDKQDSEVTMKFNVTNYSNQREYIYIYVYSPLR